MGLNVTEITEIWGKGLQMNQDVNLLWCQEHYIQCIFIDMLNCYHRGQAFKINIWLMMVVNQI